MKKPLLNLLIVLAAAAIAFNVGLRASGPLRVQCEGPKTTLNTSDAGALDDEGSCDLSWSYCWRRT
jgi:hypothetical protein